MRVAIISDIHEDIEHLEKVFSKIGELGTDMNVCLGDIIGYSSIYYRYESARDASACIQMVREKCEIVIPGNHDFSACERLPVHSSVFDYPDNWYELNIQERNELSDDKLWMHEDDLDPGLSEEEKEYLYSLPELTVQELDGYRILFSHYAYPNLSGMKKGSYTWKDEYTDHFFLMKEHDCEIGITGHAHPEGMFRVTKQRISHLPYNKWIKLKKYPVLFTVPAVNRPQNRSGFCLLDTNFKELCAIHIPTN